MSKSKPDAAMVALVDNNTSPKQRALVARHRAIVDSGVTVHIVKNKSIVIRRPSPSDVIVRTAGKATINAKTQKKFVVNMTRGTEPTNFKLLFTCI